MKKEKNCAREDFHCRCRSGELKEMGFKGKRIKEEKTECRGVAEWLGIEPLTAPQEECRYAVGGSAQIVVSRDCSLLRFL